MEAGHGPCGQGWRSATSWGPLELSAGMAEARPSGCVGVGVTGKRARPVSTAGRRRATVGPGSCHHPITRLNASANALSTVTLHAGPATEMTLRALALSCDTKPCLPEGGPHAERQHQHPALWWYSPGPTGPPPPTLYPLWPALPALAPPCPLHSLPVDRFCGLSEPRGAESSLSLRRNVPPWGSWSPVTDI